MKPCRACRQPISEQAFARPHCGAAYALVARFGLYVAEGRGQLVISLEQLLARLFS